MAEAWGFLFGNDRRYFGEWQISSRHYILHIQTHFSMLRSIRPSTLCIFVLLLSILLIAPPTTAGPFPAALVDSTQPGTATPSPPATTATPAIGNIAAASSKVGGGITRALGLSADSTADPSLPIPSRGTPQTDGYSIAFCVIFAILGLAYTFNGVAMFRATLFVTGLFFGTSVVLYALQQAKPFVLSSASVTNAVYLGISILVGVICGILLIVFWNIGIYIIGLLGGWMLGNIILNTFAITNIVARIVILVVLSLIGAVVVHFFERPAIIIATSLAGAYLTVLGVDMVVNAGVGYDLRHPERMDSKPAPQTLYEMLAIGLLALVGVIWQSCRFRGPFGDRYRARYKK